MRIDEEAAEKEGSGGEKIFSSEIQPYVARKNRKNVGESRVSHHHCLASDIVKSALHCSRQNIFSESL